MKSKFLEKHTSKILTPFQRGLLEKRLQEDLPDLYHQRIKIMLLADQGKSQIEICQILGCCRATVRYWMHIARTGMAHQWQNCPIGRPKAINEKYLARLKELINQNPRDYGYSFKRWTTKFLQKHLAKELGIEVSDRHIKRLLKQMGLSTIQKDDKSTEALLIEKHNSNILIDDIQPNYRLNKINFIPTNLYSLRTD